MWLLVLWEKRSSQEGCSPGRGTATSSSMWMGHARRPANVLCRERRIGQIHSGACGPSVPRATPDASGGKSCGAVLRFCKRIRISFSARLETPAMGNTEQNCGEQSQPSKTTEKPITTLKKVV